ncbi:MAG: FimV/HubP family polar landmark protein [Chromatocurvus sp.]
MAKRVHLSSAALIGSLLHAGTVSALGLGDITLNSYLNEPLDAEVRLIDTRDLVADEIKVRLAGAEDFERLGVDRSYFLTRIQFDVSIDRDRNIGVIRLTTTEPVLEPFVDVIIEARWPSGRLLREYTVLVDPPVFREEPLVVSASDEVAATESAVPMPDDESEAAAEPPGKDGVAGQVSTRRSDLPPGEMPQRAFSAETSEEPAPGQRYMVRRDETLWQIASRGRPPGSSVQQAMLDIQRLNPEAFINGNINRVKAGYIIYLPAAGDITSEDFSEALAEVRQQNADWASQQAGTPGVTAAASLRISADPADTSDAPSDDEPAPQVADARSTVAEDDTTRTSDRDQTARPGRSAASSASGDRAPGQAAVAQDELAGQLAEMSERLDTLEQIVALKDEQIATLEQALQEARVAARNASAAAVEAVTPPAEASARPSPPAEPTPRAASPQEAPGILERLGSWLYAVIGALLLALLGLLFWRRRRSESLADEELASDDDAMRDEDSEDVFAGVTLRDEPATTQAPSAVPIAPVASTKPKSESPDAASPRDNRGYGERRYDDYIDDSGAGDALAEADIYIAYGRYLQAAELLTTAIESEPDNAAYRLKLIELYVDMGEPEKAQDELRALGELGDADAMLRAEAIVGSIVETGHAAPASESSLELDLAPEIGAEPAPEPEPESGLERRPDYGSTPELEAKTEPRLEQAQQPKADSAEEYWLESYQGSSAARDESAGRVVSPVAEDASALDESGEDESVDATGYDTPEDRPVEEIDYEPLEFSLDDVSLDGDDVDTAGKRGVSGDAVEADATGNLQAQEEGMELELDFDELEIEDDRPVAAPDVEDDELDLSEALREAESPEELVRDASGSDEPGSDDMMFATDSDQIATKLDLARAYLDMGDDDGASRILEQVASAGSEEQQREARALLDRIG